MAETDEKYEFHDEKHDKRSAMGGKGAKELRTTGRIDLRPRGEITANNKIERVLN